MKRPGGKTYMRSMIVAGVLAAALAACKAGQDSHPLASVRQTARAGEVHRALLTVPAKEAPASPGMM